MFGVVAAGVFLMNLLVLGTVDSPTLTGGLGGQAAGQPVPEGNDLFFALAATFNSVVQLGIVLAVILGIYVSRTGERLDSAVKSSAVASTAGAGVTLLALLVLLLLTAPGGANLEAGELLKLVIAATFGTGVAGGGTAHVVENRL